MSGLILLFAGFLAVAVIDILAQTHGVDTRPDFEDARQPVCGIS